MWKGKNDHCDVLLLGWPHYSFVPLHNLSADAAHFPAHPLHQSNIPPWPCGQPDVATPCFDERSSHQFLPTFARFVVGDP